MEKWEGMVCESVNWVVCGPQGVGACVTHIPTSYCAHGYMQQICTHDHANTSFIAWLQLWFLSTRSVSVDTKTLSFSLSVSHAHTHKKHTYTHIHIDTSKEPHTDPQALITKPKTISPGESS